ncbi:porimin [Discoglossus pictus]
MKHLGDRWTRLTWGLILLLAAIYTASAQESNTTQSTAITSITPTSNSTVDNTTTAIPAKQNTTSVPPTTNITTTIATTKANPNITTQASTKAPETTKTSTVVTTNHTSVKTTPITTKTTGSLTTSIAAAAVSKGSAFDLGSFIGGIVLTLGLLAVLYFGCRYYNSKRGVRYRTIDEHEAII